MTSTSSRAMSGVNQPRPVPPHVELLIAFANSEDHELNTDDLTTRPQLTQWLFDHGLLERRIAASDDELALARQLRAGLHDALVANHDGSFDYSALDVAASQLPLRLSGTATPAVAAPAEPGPQQGLRPVQQPGLRPVQQPGLRPVQDGIRGALSRVLIAVNSSVADDTWRRLKICSADDCLWAFFDTTKNRSRAWCEWGCGNKAKTRNYRARKKAAV